MSAARAETVQPAAINAAAPQAILLIFNSPYATAATIDSPCKMRIRMVTEFPF
jgi:hypothetical protein